MQKCMGMTLIEVVVVASILSVILLFFSNFMLTQNAIVVDQSVKIGSEHNLRALLDELVMELSDARPIGISADGRTLIYQRPLIAPDGTGQLIIKTNAANERYVVFGTGDGPSDAVEDATYTLTFIPGNRQEDQLSEEALALDLDQDGSIDSEFQLGTLIRTRSDDASERILRGRCAIKVGAFQPIFQMTGEIITNDSGPDAIPDAVKNPLDANEKLDSEHDLNLNGRWDGVLTLRLFLVAIDPVKKDKQVLKTFATKIRMSNAR